MGKRVMVGKLGRRSDQSLPALRPTCPQKRQRSIKPLQRATTAPPWVPDLPYPPEPPQDAGGSSVYEDDMMQPAKSGWSGSGPGMHKTSQRTSWSAMVFTISGHRLRICWSKGTSYLIAAHGNLKPMTEMKILL
jgi:hypothetical protein